MGGGQWGLTDSPLVLSTRYTVSMLTSAANFGKVAHRDELVKEVCWLTGTTPEATIPPSLRRNPNLFFAMWEKLRSKAQKMIAEATKPAVAAAKPVVGTELLAPAVAADALLEGTPEPGLTEAGRSEGSSASSSSAKLAKFMLAYLMENDEIVNTKRIPVPLSMSSLYEIAVSTFNLPQDSDLAFEVLEATTQDMLAA